MKARAIRPVRVAVLALAALILVQSEALAQQLAKPYYKNGPQVRSAFRSVIADTLPATVRVFSDGEAAALGAIVDGNGYILTKASQLDGSISCRLQDGREFDARISGIDKDNDVAMLKIEARSLPTIRWNTIAPAVGKWLATPGSEDLPISIGIVSTKARPIPQERGILGIAIAEGDLGPEISQVFPQSGAELAGLRAGDVVLRVAGNVVDNGRALAESIQQFSPGDSLSLLIRRGEDEMDVEAVLGDEFSSFSTRGAIQNRMGGDLSRRRVGFTSALQHDQVLRPEECGGPVVDLSGRVVGLNIARAGRTETFALPAAVILARLEDLKSGKLAPSDRPAQLVEVGAVKETTAPQ